MLLIRGQGKAGEASIIVVMNSDACISGESGRGSLLPAQWRGVFTAHTIPPHSLSSSQLKFPPWFGPLFASCSDCWSAVCMDSAAGLCVKFENPTIVLNSTGAAGVLESCAHSPLYTAEWREGRNAMRCREASWSMFEDNRVHHYCPILNFPPTAVISLPGRTEV